MSGFGQYLKDTQGELRHVAWPTRAQTIVYTILVALVSIGVALYLGFFDFIFTTGLSRTLNALPNRGSQQDAGSVLVQGQGLTLTQSTTTSQ